MASPARTLDEVLAGITPLLAARGYRRSARNFVAQADGVARVVQVQSRQLKKPEEASFTLNALVTSVAFHTWRNVAGSTRGRGGRWAAMRSSSSWRSGSVAR